MTAVDGELPDVLRSVLCKRLTPVEAAELAADMVPLETPAGRFVIREGEPSTGLLILLRGTAEIIKRTPDGGSRTIATVTAPTVLGEVGLVADEPRSASVRTITACDFQLLARADFRRLLEEESLAAYKLIATMAEVLARRLALLTRKFVGVNEIDQDAALGNEPDAPEDRLEAE